MNPSLIGAYGSNTGVTPNLDEMATYGVLLDQCFVDTVDLETQLTSIANALHALQPTRPVELWQALSDAGKQITFLTDDPAAAAWAEESGCSQVGLIETIQPLTAAERPIDCACVDLFEAAAVELESDSVDGLVWIHSRGLRGPWDAPIDLRQQFVDPEDPSPPGEVGPPEFDVTDTTDPDAVVGWSQVAAAQLSIIDESLGMLWSVLKSRHDAAEWFFAAVGLGGVPLGEHGRVGWGRPQCHAEETQTAAIFCPAPAVPIGWRRSELFQLADIGATLWTMCGLALKSDMWGRCVMEWQAVDAPAKWPIPFQSAMGRVDEAYWLRVPAWSAAWCLEEAGRIDNSEDPSHAYSSVEAWLTNQRPKLYVKPDDRWEVSEIADRCPAVVEQMQAHAVRMLAALAENQRSQLPQIDPLLTDLLR